MQHVCQNRFYTFASIVLLSEQKTIDRDNMASSSVASPPPQSKKRTRRSENCVADLLVVRVEGTHNETAAYMARALAEGDWFDALLPASGNDDDADGKRTFRRALVGAYARFITLKLATGDVELPFRLSPSGLVDAVWHAHMLQPQHYMAMCQAVLGRGQVLWHDTNTAASADRAQRYARTRALLQSTFAVPKTPALELEQSACWPDESSSDDGESSVKGMTLFFKSLMGTTDVVHGLESSHSVEQVKQRYEQQHGTPADQLRFIFAGKQLEDDRTLADYNIQRGATLHVILRLRGC